MPCIHKAVIGCALTALPGCCSCSDQRPYAEAYPIYIDGHGMKMQGKRWARYCWKCRDYWKQNDAEELQLQRDAANRRDTQAPTWSFPAAMPPSTPVSGRLRGGAGSGTATTTPTGRDQPLTIRPRVYSSTVRNQIERHRREHSTRTASPPLRRASPEVMNEQHWDHVVRKTTSSESSRRILWHQRRNRSRRLPIPNNKHVWTCMGPL